MSEIFLYRNTEGRPVTQGSYSARRTFKYCPQLFKYERIDGWYEKEERAATHFGHATEFGIQYFEQNARMPGAAARAFAHRWAEAKNDPDFESFKYTGCEGSWEQLDRAGREMMRLYEGVCDRLPISRDARWQVPVRKKLFPGTELDVLTNKAIFDILSYPGTKNELIIDMKTAGDDLDDYMVELDPQLLEYAWEYGASRVAFLWLVKKSHEIEKGSRITLMMDFGPWKFGTEVRCLKYEKYEPATEAIPEVPAEGRKKARPAVPAKPAVPARIVLGNDETFVQYCEHVKGLSGRALDNAKDEFITLNDCPRILHYAEDGSPNVTKQRLQFAVANVSKERMQETGQDVARTTAEMMEAARTGIYPKKPGIRFPDQKCNFCTYRWLCLNRPEERDRYLGRKGQEWLDGHYEAD